MALINEHIAHIQTIINKGAKSDDSRYSDRHLYFILKYLRAELIEQKAKKNQFLNPANYQVIPCLELKEASPNECGCSASTVFYLKSIQKFPRILNGRTRLLLTVRTPAGYKIDPMSMDSIRYNKHSITKKNALGYFIYNDHLIVIGPHNNMLEAVSTEAIHADPLDLDKIITCGGSKCFDPKTQDFPIDEDLIRALHNLTYDEVVRIMQAMPEDQENNAKPADRQQNPQ